MTFKKIMEHEEALLGRPCKLLGQSLIKTSGIVVRVVVYKPRAVELSRVAPLGGPPRVQLQHEVRVAAYVDDQATTSIIAKLWSKWYRKKGSHDA